MAPPREPVYVKDEKALCFHHEFLYEAKVLESRLSDPTDKKSPLQYRVHYKGWKSTWDDWVPGDRLRKLTEENKQLATNLKREMDDMNPRTAAKSTKSAKKKTAGSDLSSARGSEERQSLPPGRGQKRGRDNEIEKVRSQISSNSSPSRQPSQRAKPHKKALESMDAQDSSLSPPRKNNKFALDPSVPSPQLQPSANTAEHKQAKGSRPRTREASVATAGAPIAANPKLTSLSAAELYEVAQDIDVDFWTQEAALLKVDSSHGATPIAEKRRKAPIDDTDASMVSKPPPKKRTRTEEYVPLDQVSDLVLQNRVLKMLRHKEKTIGKGLDSPWPDGSPKGPQRHPKWIYTLHVDSHNHAKLAFYADLSPTAHPVIAGFAPENHPPDLVRKSKVYPQQSRKRMARATQRKDVEGPAAKKRRTSGSSKSDEGPQHDSGQEKPGSEDKGAQADNPGAEGTSEDGAPPAKDVDQAKEFAKGFQTLKQRLEVPDSEASTNSDLEQEEHFHARPAVKIEVPDHLKAILVDDWENVTKNLSLVPLPADHPVSEILSTYFEEEKGKRRLGSAEADLLEEVVQGTKDYFEQCLGKLLLYRFEREQYFRLCQTLEKGEEEFEGRRLGGKKMVDIYGAEHLCRLFVSLPELIAQTNMDAQSVSKLRQEIQALTAWLGRNSARFFTAEYEAAPQEYVEKARGL